MKTLHFDSETGMPQYDPVARKVYVNLQGQNMFAVIDPATDQVVGRYRLGSAREITAWHWIRSTTAHSLLVKKQADDRFRSGQARSDRVFAPR